MLNQEMFIQRKLKRIWANSNDVHVRNYVIYVDSNGIACVDPEGDIPIGSRTLAALYTKSLLISDSGVFYTPISMDEEGPATIISYLKYVAGEPVLSTATGVDIPTTDPLLTLLSVGEEVLIPALDPPVLEYTVTTTNESDLVTIDFIPLFANVSVRLNNNELLDLSEPLVWTEGANVLTIALDLEDTPTVYTITVTKEAAPVAPVLSSLDIGGKTLTPEFASGTIAYAASTSDASDLLTLSASEGATVSVELNGTTVDDTSDPLTWSEGENTLEITVSLGDLSTVYTITVIKEAAPVAPVLSSLDIGEKTLTPEFASSTLAYTVSTDAASDLLILSASPEDAVVSVKLNDSVVSDISDPLEWSEGENDLEITVSLGELSTVYTIGVTKE